MSYPDLGCFAECLTCELCTKDWGTLPNLFPDNYDWNEGMWNDWDDWAPDPEDGGILDDFPTGIPIPGGGEAKPTWNPWGFELEWKF
jgi:hypothetical protein